MPLLRSPKPVHLALLLAIMAGIAGNGHARSRGAELPSLDLELPPVPFAFPAAGKLEVTIASPAHPGSGGAVCGGMGRQNGFRFVQICGGAYAGDFLAPSRTSRLADPVAALSGAYRQCRVIAADVLETRVSVEQYPEDYFGDQVSEGMLRRERREFADEARLGQLFTLLVEAIGASDEDGFHGNWPDGPVGGTSVRDIRWESGLVPELAFEFVGGPPLRVEVSTRQRRMLVLAGGKWDVYLLDRRSVARFEAFLASGPGEVRMAAVTGR